MDGGATGWLTGGCSGVEYVSGAVGVGEVAGSRGSIDGWFVVAVDDDEPDEDKSTTSPLSPNPQQTSRKRRTVKITHQRVRVSIAPHRHSRVALENALPRQLLRIQVCRDHIVVTDSPGSASIVLHEDCPEQVLDQSVSLPGRPSLRVVTLAVEDIVARCQAALDEHTPVLAVRDVVDELVSDRAGLEQGARAWSTVAASPRFTTPPISPFCTWLGHRA